MSKPEDLISKIPFFKKRPALTAIIVILLAVLTFSILNLDKMLNFKIWMLACRASYSVGNLSGLGNRLSSDRRR